MGERSELREMQKLEGHTGKVWSVAWNPVSGTNGKPAILASCSSDETVRIWRQNPITSAFECMATIGGAQTGTVRSCSWSPDGDSLAVANYDGTTSIWDKIENGFEHFCDLKGHKKEVVSVSWNTSGHIATCSRNSVWIWELVDYKEYEPLMEFYHTKDFEMVQWHPVEDILFSCGCDKIIKVWKRYSDDKLWCFAQDLDGHSSKVCSISFDATGDKMVTSSADLSIKVWGAEKMQSRGDYQPWGWGDDYQPWKLLYTLSGFHKRTIFSVHWSSEGIIASGAADGAICLFEENRDGMSLEGRGAMYKLLLTKEKAHDTNVNLVQWPPKSQERSETMHESLLTKEKANETDVKSSQHQVPKLQERNNDMCKLLLTREKANETEVTAVQWAPEEIGLFASSSNDGTVKIWKFTSRQ